MWSNPWETASQIYCWNPYCKTSFFVQWHNISMPKEKCNQVWWLRAKFKKCTAGKAKVLKFVKNCKYPIKLKCNYNIVSNTMCIQRNLLVLPPMNFLSSAPPPILLLRGCILWHKGQFNSFAETNKKEQWNCHIKSSFISKQTY